MFFSGLLSGGGGESGSLTDAGWWRGMLGRGSNSAGVAVTPDTAIGLPVVQNCVGLLADTYAMLPVEIYERGNGGDRISATSHPLYDVLKYQPNSWQTPFEQRQYEQVALGIRGNAFTFSERREDGNIRALYTLENDQVQVFKGADLRPYYQIGSNRVSMDYIHHVRWMPGKNGYMSPSVIQQHAEAMGLAQAVRTYTGKSFANGAAVSGVIERPRESPAIKDQGAIDGILDQWGQKYGGMDNAKKVALLQEGMTFKPVSMTNLDADIARLLGLSDVDMARIYRIPLTLINNLEKATFNNMEQLFIQFVVFGLLPWVRRHEESQMRDYLLPGDRRKYYIEYNLSGLLRGDQKTRYEAYAIGRQWGWLSVNDIRRLENLPPVPGGNIYLQPLNMVDAGSNPDLSNPAVRSQLELQQREIERILAG